MATLPHDTRCSRSTSGVSTPSASAASLRSRPNFNFADLASLLQPAPHDRRLQHRQRVQQQLVTRDSARRGQRSIVAGRS